MALNGNPDETNGYNSVIKNGEITNANFVKSVIVPIGSVLDWLKSLTGCPSLPDGFVECNGQTLSDSDSPFDGQIIPNLNGSGATTGTATSGANTTITQSTASWGINDFAGFVIKLTGGTGSGQIRQVVSNTATAITIQGNWTTNPGSGTTFSVSSPQRFLRGSTTSGGIGGEDAHLLTIGELANHNHTTAAYNGNSANADGFYIRGSGSITANINTTYVGGGQAHNIIPSYYETVKIMRVK